MVARANFERVRRDIERRIGPVCPDWPRAELIQLTLRMARVHLKYRRSTSLASGFDSELN